jgi:hypothetical protein
MMNNKLDITSTAIEKGIDLIGGFIEKLAGSTLEEAGLFIGDKVRIRRLRNQIKIFSDAKRIAEENNITIKQINLKTLVPLLEFSSLEEDETLQQKWSNLIVNFSNANEIYESSIYPFILNQLTSNEAKEIDRIYEVKQTSRLDMAKSGVEASNLIRLGLIEFNVVTRSTTMFKGSYLNCMITDLGKKFVECCANPK